MKNTSDLLTSTYWVHMRRELFRPIIPIGLALVLFILHVCNVTEAIADPAERIDGAPGSNSVDICKDAQTSAIPDDPQLYFDISPPCKPAKRPYLFIDEFERNNSETLGPDWVDCKSVHPDSFEPLGIYDGGVVVADPYTRPGEYDEIPYSDHPPTRGRLHPAIGCAFVDTGSTTISVKTIWSGNLGVDHPPPVSHVEASPLLYIDPSNPRFGFGAWTSQLYGGMVFLIGYIGSPVEDFEVIAHAVVGEHESGTPREVELRAEEPGKVTLWVDGKQLRVQPGGLEPLQVDPDMIHSTLHGIAVDAHLVDPIKNVPVIKSIEAVTIKQLEVQAPIPRTRPPPTP